MSEKLKFVLIRQKLCNIGVIGVNKESDPMLKQFDECLDLKPYHCPALTKNTRRRQLFRTSLKKLLFR